jgi:hypothetical protein
MERRAMRKVIGSLFQSLDGVIQAPGGPEEDATAGGEPAGLRSPVQPLHVAGVDRAEALPHPAAQER